MKHMWEATVFTNLDNPEEEIYGHVCLVCGKETVEEFELEIEDCIENE